MRPYNRSVDLKSSGRYLLANMQKWVQFARPFLVFSDCQAECGEKDQKTKTHLYFLTMSNSPGPEVQNNVVDHVLIVHQTRSLQIHIPIKQDRCHLQLPELKFELPGKTKTRRKKKRRMMDLFFPLELQRDSDMFWYEAFEAPQPQVNQSAFVPYRDTPRNEFGAENSGNMKNCVNVKKRMVEFLRRSWHPRNEIQEYEKERGFRHMMNERMRRERQKQNYMTLHSMLPFGTKVCFWISLFITSEIKRIHFFFI